MVRALIEEVGVTAGAPQRSSGKKIGIGLLKVRSVGLAQRCPSVSARGTARRSVSVRPRVPAWRASRCSIHRQRIQEQPGHVAGSAVAGKVTALLARLIRPFVDVVFTGQMPGRRLYTPNRLYRRPELVAII